MDGQLRVRYAEAATRNIGRTGATWWIVAAALAACVAFGIYAYAVQVREGHAVTGVTHSVFWGLYIVDFVFFIGISYGGAIVSAILRLTNAKWRAPISRLAEGTAVVTLGVGAASVLVDVGRPDRMLNLFFFAQPGSPITWDWIAINTYLVGTLIFFLLPLIPDVAREAKDAEAPSPRVRLYRLLSFGWYGGPQQERSLVRAMTIMSVLIIPLAITVHSVLAWLFAVTVQSGWHSTIFAPLFVLAAMLSGVATVILVIAVARRVYGLEEFITAKHFRYLGYLLIALDAAYLYFMVSEYLTEGYVQEEPLGDILRAYLVGPYSNWFWMFVGGGLVVPLVLVALPGRWIVGRAAVASGLVVAGMWVKRFLIVILPGVLLPVAPGDLYRPTWVELGILAGSLAAIPLGLMALFALFPVMSIHEMEEVEGLVRPARAAHAAVAPPVEGRRAPRALIAVGATALVLVVAGWTQGLLGPRVSLQLPPGGAPDQRPAVSEGGPAAARPAVPAAATSGAVTVTPSRRADLGYVLEAQVVAKDGSPMNEVAVRFYDLVYLLGPREMLVGSERTDGRGRASLTYLPAEPGAHTIIARYDGRSGPAEVRTDFEADRTATAAYHRELLPLADFSRLLPAFAAAALVAVWALFAFAVIGGVGGIAGAPRPVITRRHWEDQG